MTLNNSLASSAATVYQILQILQWYVVPFFHQNPTQLLDILDWWFMVLNCSAKDIPNMFNNVQVWGIWRPVYSGNACLLQCLLRYLCTMSRCIVILEDQILTRMCLYVGYDLGN